MSDSRVEVPTEILTERLLLYRYRAEDTDRVFEAIEESRAELERWMPWAPHIRSAEQLREGFVDLHRMWENDEDYGYTISRREDGRLLGSINYQDPNWSIPAFEIGYWMRTSETGKGYVSEAVRALIRVAFRDLGAKRLQIPIDEGNARSRRVAESVGATLEGHTRNDNVLPNGEVGGSLIYGLIDTDEAVRRLLAQPDPS